MNVIETEWGGNLLNKFHLKNLFFYFSPSLAAYVGEDKRINLLKIRQQSCGGSSVTTGLHTTKTGQFPSFLNANQKKTQTHTKEETGVGSYVCCSCEAVEKEKRTVFLSFTLNTMRDDEKKLLKTSFHRKCSEEVFSIYTNGLLQRAKQ